MSVRNKIAMVQALRAAASMMVVLWHTSIYVGPYGTGLFGPALMFGGVYGVTLFFILSGFIMVFSTHKMEGGADAAIRFLVRRFSRVWPVYLVATLTAVALSGAYTPQALRRFLFSMAFLPTDASAVTTIGYPTLAVGWTLNYEMYFYAIFGVAMLSARWRWHILFAWLTAVVLVPAMAVGNWTLSAGTAFGFGVAYLELATNPIVIPFFVGVLIGLVYCSSSVRMPPALAVAFVGLALAFAVWQFAYQFRIGSGVFYCGLSAVPLVFFGTMAAKSDDIPVSRTLVYLGEISFSLYLFHPLAMSVYWLFKRDVFDPAGWVPGAAEMALVIAISILVAMVSHRYLELGLSEWVRRSLLRVLGRTAYDHSALLPVSQISKNEPRRVTAAAPGAAEY